MATLSQPHWEALTPDTLKAFKLAASLPIIKDFYLAGGTGLALHLGHRFSIDLDFFSPDASAVNADQRGTIRASFAEPTLAITFDSDGTFAGTWRQVGISFFRLELYPLVQEPLKVDGIGLATLQEIGAMKLAAIIGRGTRKDLVDLYYILQDLSLEEVFKIASKKYARIHSFPVSAVRALAYFDDANALPMPRMLDQTPWPAMKKFLEKQALEAGRLHLADLWE